MTRMTLVILLAVVLVEVAKIGMALGASASPAAVLPDPPDWVSILDAQSNEVMAFGPDGKVYWRGREILDDAQMVEALKAVVLGRPCTVTK